LSTVILLGFFLSSKVFLYGCNIELQGLGKLAEKFPNIASTSIYYLVEFLVTPSHILLTLHQQCENAVKDIQKLKITGMMACYCRDENRCKKLEVPQEEIQPIEVIAKQHDGQTVSVMLFVFVRLCLFWSALVDI
jgi:hypothetical protein